MIAFGTRDHASSRRRPVSSPDGVVYMKSEWMESGDDPVLSPTVFLIEQPPDSVAQVHFHRQNQFQLFVAGSGAIGHHPVRSLTVHYAGAYTGYGPLAAGSEGLQYLTLRPVLDSGAFFIPHDRAELRRGPKRGGQAGPMPIPAESDLKALNAPQTVTLLEDSADGRAAILRNLPPGGSVAVAGRGAAQGCFAVVVAGAGRCEGRRLGMWESVFVSADQGDCALTAEEVGLSVVLLSVPARDAAYA